MTEFLDAAIVVAILLGSSAAGAALQRLLSERHRSRESMELVQLVMTMLVTFAALVLGLLTTSVKSSFDVVGHEVKGLAVELIRLDQSLRQWGPETEHARALLRSYAAAAIATTWTEEPNPPGDYYPLPASSKAAAGRPPENPELGDMLGRVEAEIRALQPQDAKHSRLAADCLNQFEHLMQTRWKLIEDAGSSISTPFYFVLVFWLVIVFAGFGLYAPRHLLSYVTIGLGALSIASAIYVILDMDTPFSGVFTVSSAPLRDALEHVSR